MVEAPSSWFADQGTLLAELRQTRVPAAPAVPAYADLVEIGRGGQGVVFSATQTSTGRRVAIKVLAGGALADRERRLRFEREVRLVATLAHDGIVRVHDSGVTDQGLPFLVMELIEGQRLDVWWQGLPADPRTRHRAIVARFAQLAAALAHAHERGVIHRDLKPSNVRVAASGRSCILDFGLARVTGADTAGVSLTGEFLGSLPWASPEQVSGHDAAICTATDVYQLGVMLYQALCGSFPYRVEGSFREVIEQISSAEPRLPRAVDRSIDEGLSAVVQRCLQKSPERRYASARQLEEDLERWLSGAPVEARGDSTWYVVRKQLRRHRAAVGGLAAFLVVAVVFGITMAVLYARTARAERTARDELDQSRAMYGFLEGVLGSADPVFQGRDARVLDSVLRASDDLERRPGLGAGARARLHVALGEVYLNLGALERAAVELPLGLDGLRREFGPDHATTLAAAFVFGRLLMLEGRTEEAERQIAGARAAVLRFHGADREFVGVADGALGALRFRQGRLAEAKELLTNAIAEQRIEGSDDLQSCITLSNLALTLAHSGETVAAESLYETTIAAARASYPADSLAVLTLEQNHASFLHSLGKLDAARKEYEAVLPRYRKALGDDHYATLSATGNYAKLLLNQRAFDAAEPLMRTVVAGLERRQGKEHPSTMLAAHNLGALLVDWGKLTDAEPILKATVELRSRMLGAEHADTLATRSSLATLLWRLGQREEGLRIDEDVLAIKRRTLGDHNSDTAISLNNVAGKLEELGQRERALALFQEAIAMGNRTLSEGHWIVALFRSNCGRCLRSMGRFEPAARVLQSAVSVLESTFGAGDARCQQAIKHLVGVYEDWGKPEDAEVWRQRLVEPAAKR